MIVVLEGLDRLDTARGVSPAQKRQTQRLVEKYADILDISTLPEITIRNNLHVNWLGRTLWTTKNPDNTVIELQRSVLDDPRTLERVVAHEMVHHVQLLEQTEEDIERFKRGAEFDGHGRRFLELAEQVNDHVGDPNFVTVTSDETYEVKSKSYFLLVVPFGDEGPYEGKYGYAAAGRIGPKGRRFIEKYTGPEYNAKLMRSNDPRWIAGGAKIGKQFGVPRDDADQATLKELYEAAR